MVVVHVEMILAVAGGAATHQIQDPLGLTRAPIHLEAGTAVALMAVVRLIAGNSSQIDTNRMRLL